LLRKTLYFDLINRKLVENRLSACVNIIPSVLSIYEWKGKIETDSEVLMIIKTRTSRIEELTSFVKDNHPYEVCEVITFPVSHRYID
jgi:periplasmic divalent cation tolerance protein